MSSSKRKPKRIGPGRHIHTHGAMAIGRILVVMDPHFPMGQRVDAFRLACAELATMGQALPPDALAVEEEGEEVGDGEV